MDRERSTYPFSVSRLQPSPVDVAAVVSIQATLADRPVAVTIYETDAVSVKGQIRGNRITERADAMPKSAGQFNALIPQGVYKALAGFQMPFGSQTIDII